MDAIKATWTNGQIIPNEPGMWPEGSELLVEPVSPPPSKKIGLDESEWRDDAAGWRTGKPGSARSSLWCTRSRSANRWQNSVKSSVDLILKPCVSKWAHAATAARIETSNGFTAACPFADMLPTSAVEQALAEDEVDFGGLSLIRDAQRTG